MVKKGGAPPWGFLPVYMIPLISTDMLILLLPFVLLKFAAESWRLSEAVGRRKPPLVTEHTHAVLRFASGC